MNFENYKLTTDKYGFKFAKNGIMLGETECECLICHKPTRFIEVCSESNICSDECLHEFNKMYKFY